MAKELKRATELEALIMQEVNKIRACEGTTGITVRALDDDRVDANWGSEPCTQLDNYVCGANRPHRRPSSTPLQSPAALESGTPLADSETGRPFARDGRASLNTAAPADES